MTTDIDSECSYVANLVDFNVIKIIVIRVIIVKRVIKIIIEIVISIVIK